MKTYLLVILTLLSATTRSQSYKLEVNSGNHDQIISADLDREANQLIALDKLGFVVVWDLSNFSILLKFQLPPESAFGDTKRQVIGKYAIKAYDSVITISYPKNYYNAAHGERLVDVYDRRTGAFKIQSPLGKISSLCLTRDQALLGAFMTTTKNGYTELFTEGQLVKSYAGTITNSEATDALVSCLQLDEKKNRFAVGYENGKVEIRDLKTLRVIQSFTDFVQDDEKNINQVAFIPGTDQVVFGAEHSGKFIIRNGKTGAFLDSMELETDVDYKISVSPSGKYLSAMRSGFYYLFVRDLQRKKTEKKLLHDPQNGLTLMLTEAFFINDDMLVAAGNNGSPQGGINTNTNGIGNAGAYLGLIELETSSASANLNYTKATSWIESYGTKVIKTSTFETLLYDLTSDDYIYANPSMFTLKTGRLTGNNEEFTRFLNSKGILHTWVGGFSKWDSNTAPDLAFPNIAGEMFNKRAGNFNEAETDTFYIAFYNIPRDSFTGYSKLVLPIKDAPYYSMLGVLSNRSVSFFNHTFKNERGRKESRLIVFSGSGDKLLDDSLVNTYSNKTISISADGQYIAYQSAPGTLTVRSLKDYSVFRTFRTGFKKTSAEGVTGYAYPQFLAARPGVLVHEAYQERNGYQQFCLLSTDMGKDQSDTVLSFGIRPIYYEADSTGSIMTMLYNYDFSDSVFNDPAMVQKLAEQNLKPAFKPTVALYDREKKDFVSFIHTGTSGNAFASLRGDWLTVLQNDGQLLYINTKEKDKKIVHVIDGKTQALVADSFYYASPGLVPLIKFKTPTQTFAAAQADVFLNRPHAILEQFGTGIEYRKPYQLAFEKRLSQQKLTNENFRSWLTGSSAMRTSGAAQSFIVTDKKEVNLPFLVNADQGSISKILVQVNGQPVFGKKGPDIKKVLADGKIDLELNANDNYITIVAEKEDGRQLDPVKYYYYYKPKLSRLPRLYFFSAGVSDYKDSTYNLKYAAKDAADIFQAFKYKSYDTIISSILTDREVTKPNIDQWAKKLAGAGIEDIVVVYFAGHGLLDARNNFYYAVHDMDFKVPEKKGLSYEDILDLIDKSPSRKKILLLDACHSGAFDRSEAKQLNKTGSNGGGSIVNSEKRGVKIEKGEYNQLSEPEAFILMNQLFTDFSNDLGIDVIAASLGNSYALEMQSLKNGLFTYVMIRAVALSMAAQGDKVNETQNITMAQVKEYVAKEVKRLSNGAQIPSIRSNNIQSNSITFYYSSDITSWLTNWEEQGRFLEKYK